MLFYYEKRVDSLKNDVFVDEILAAFVLFLTSLSCTLWEFKDGELLKQRSCERC